MEIWTLGLPTPVALGTVAVIGYLIGRAHRRVMEYRRIEARELKRAKTVIHELETVTKGVRRSLAAHHSNVLYFKERVAQLSGKCEDAAWHDLSEEAERMLKPTVQLANQIAHAYDEIRQQTNLLMTFTEVRTDPLTGLSNRRALDESLLTMFAMMSRYGNHFSIAILDIDHFKQVNDQQGHLQGDHVLQQVARLLDQCVRETDIVTRYGGEEFVIVMPETDLNRAAFISERIRARSAAELSLTISGGVAMALDGDTPRTLLTRADSALYGAKSAGRNAIYQHNGQNIEPLSASSKLVESDDCPMDDTAEPATENHADEPTDCQAARV